MPWIHADGTPFGISDTVYLINEFAKAAK